MISANELRIGNLVKYHDDDTLFTVIGIDDLGIGVKNEEQHTWIEYDCFSPIPITEETLKLDDEFWSFEGFGTRLIYQHKQFKAIKIEYISDNDCFIYFNDNVINLRKYVHEVQNLFHSLTSKELELK